MEMCLLNVSPFGLCFMGCMLCFDVYVSVEQKKVRYFFVVDCVDVGVFLFVF